MKSKSRSFLVLLFSISLVFGTTSASQALPRNIDDDVNAAQQELESASALVREVAAELAETIQIIDALITEPQPKKDVKVNEVAIT